MSRGFVKEDDQEEPPFIPPRAPLPAGAENYVTPEGYEELLEEKKGLLERQKAVIELSERERRREQQSINVMLQALEERIQSAQIIESPNNPQEVRFGTTVQFKMLPMGQTQEFKIVGVDEANLKKGKIAFTAPIIRAITGHRANEKVNANIQDAKREVTVLSIR